MIPTNNSQDFSWKSTLCRSVSWRSTLYGLIILMATQFVTACVPLVVSTAAVTTIDLSTERRTVGRNIDDNLLELKLRKAYWADDRLGLSVNISVTAVNGVVLLTGEVHTDDQRQYAESLAKQNLRTQTVVNELDLSGKTNFNSRINDTYITAKVKSKLLQADNVPSSSIKVVTERGEVYLLGLVTRAEAEAAVAVAKSVRGVTHIIKVFEYIKK